SRSRRATTAGNRPRTWRSSPRAGRTHAAGRRLPAGLFLAAFRWRWSGLRPPREPRPEIGEQRRQGRQPAAVTGSRVELDADPGDDAFREIAHDELDSGQPHPIADHRLA